MINVSLATETVCARRYKPHYYDAQDLDSEPAATQFLDHALAGQVHGDRLAARIDRLGGTPELNPETLMSRSQTEYNTRETLPDVIKEDLIAEHIVTRAYGEVIEWVGHGDQTADTSGDPRRRGASALRTCSRCPNGSAELSGQLPEPA